MTLTPHAVAAMMLVAAVGQAPQFGESSATCQSNIVSATVVATFCGHREGNDRIMNLFILWRGRPGWFQRRETSGPTGTRGSHIIGGGFKGHVTEYNMYGDVTVGFDADFDAGAVTIDAARIPLDAINSILVDDVDRADVRRIASTLRLDPRLPLAGDVNLLLARRSPVIVKYLQCAIAMPVPRSARGPIPQPPVITVCEKLKAERR